MSWGKCSLAVFSGANCSRAWIAFNCLMNESCNNFSGGMPAHCDVSCSFLSAVADFFASGRANGKDQLGWFTYVASRGSPGPPGGPCFGFCSLFRQFHVNALQMQCV